jgi:trehalose 6-phosphate phosphatase
VYSISIHYRNARDKRKALRAIDRAMRGLRRARRLGGKLVVNIVPSGAPGKGVALERARRLLVCDTALYVGDDETDEDAFAAVRSGRLLSVKVGPIEKGSRALYLLTHQRHIDGLLRQLVAFRPHRRPDSQ